MQYQQSDPAKMHSRLLANKMKQLKSVDEEVSKMCNIVEEYVAERLAEEKAKVAEAEKKAATAKTNSNLNCIKNLMKSMQLSAENAMHAIGIPPAEHVHYLAML